MPRNTLGLSSLGWNASFEQQLSNEELEQTQPYRVMEAHRGEVILSMGNEELVLPLKGKKLAGLNGDQITVGDWLLISRDDGAFIRLLDRTSLIKRQSAGLDGPPQMVAANINTLFIVTSCNEDFNLSRLERYLVIAYAAGVYPVIVLTKQDLIDDATSYVEKARTLGKNIAVEIVSGLVPSTLNCLQNWCKLGQTIALVGSSGVGKSTLVNGLGAAPQKTGKIRESDAKGRHTTTHRALLPIADGPVLLDSPGMRGLGLVDASHGLDVVFEEVIDLSLKCRFSDCQHDQEPGCAIKGAIGNQVLTQRRVNNYNKLIAEQKYHSAPEIERRRIDKNAATNKKKGNFGKKSNRRHK